MSQEQIQNDTPPADAAGVDAGAVDTAAEAAADANVEAGEGSFVGDAATGDAGGDDAAAGDPAVADGDGDAGEAGDDPVADAAADEPVAPYEGLTAPEGTALVPEDIEAATPLLRSFGVPDERAQEFLEGAAPIIGGIVNRALDQAQASVMDNRAALTREWIDEIENDPDIGGANLDRSKALIAKARDTFLDKPTVDFLNETGLGNHPGLARALARIGGEISEGSIHRGEGGQQQQTTAQKLYDPAFHTGSRD